MSPTIICRATRKINISITFSEFGLQSITKNGRALELTQREYDILCYFLERPAQVVSREELMEKVWGYDYYGDDRAVDTQIKRIRQKINPADAKGWKIQTVYGVGYRFELLDEDEPEQLRND